MGFGSCLFPASFRKSIPAIRHENPRKTSHACRAAGRHEDWRTTGLLGRWFHCVRAGHEQPFELVHDLNRGRDKWNGRIHRCHRGEATRSVLPNRAMRLLAAYRFDLAISGSVRRMASGCCSERLTTVPAVVPVAVPRSEQNGTRQICMRNIPVQTGGKSGVKPAIRARHKTCDRSKQPRVFRRNTRRRRKQIRHLNKLK